MSDVTDPQALLGAAQGYMGIGLFEAELMTAEPRPFMALEYLSKAFTAAKDSMTPDKLKEFCEEASKVLGVIEGADTERKLTTGIGDLSAKIEGVLSP